MSGELLHRGPDDSGVFVDRHVGFCFRRLAIIDLAQGNQPFYNADGSIVLICNGEIYNYKELRCRLISKGYAFKTNCDVEVLVYLYEEYGTEFLNMLNGQFAFAIYDKNKDRLFLARDHVGIAPLFYSLKEDVFLFGSEIKALLQHPSIKRRVNLRGLDQMISFPGLSSPTTMFEEVHSLMAGHYLLLEEGRVRVHEYWDLDYPQEKDEIRDQDEGELIEEMDEVLTQAVRYRLNADVPVGIYLSGGLDSSLIGALVHQLSPDNRRNSFSVTFDDPRINERKYQQIMSDRLGSLHKEYLFSNEDIAGRLRAAVFYAESPLKETYNTCSLALSELVKQNNLKVILTGEGADELFGGYVGYKFDQWSGCRGDAGNGYETAMEEDMCMKLWGDAGFKYEKKYFEFNELKSALYSDALNQALPEFNSVREGIVKKCRLAGRSYLHKRSYVDFKLRISDHLVADHGDRVAYANSVEARYPFLDINFINFARNMHPGFKLKGLTEKYILKKYAARYVPADIINREKFSFVAPGSQYLLSKNIGWVNDILSEETIKRQGYFNYKTVERLKKAYLSEDFSLNQTFETDFLMILITFGIFLEVFDIPDLN